MTISDTEASIVQWIAQADRADAAGRPEEALRALRAAAILAPEHPRVLNALGMHALKIGDATAARMQLERATVANPQSATLWLNLALICRVQRDSAGELAALDKSLAADPYFYLALLQKATLFERQGNHKEAASVYQAFLHCVPRDGRPAALTQAVEHARRVVQEHSAALEHHLRDRLRSVRDQHAHARLERFDHCMDVLLGKKRVYVQQPTFMHFPGLPAIQFYDRGAFPWLDALELATDTIREELKQLLARDSADFAPYVANPEGAPLNQWKELNHSPRWNVFYLWRDGAPLADHIARYPRTARVLSSLPLCDVPGVAPTAFFSILAPKTRIPPHTGVSNTRLVAHLPLIVPPGCGFRVGADTREWQPGKAWIFDDTIEHEAWNESDQPRAVLIFDIWNPYLTAAERDLVRVLTEGITEFHGSRPVATGL